MELMRASGLPKPVQQSNLSFSRAGVIRGLHYHERGQDDLFACVQGTVRVVVLDRGTGRDVHRGHRRRQPGRHLHPRHQRARLRGAHGLPVPLPRDRGVRPGRPGRARRSLGRPARRRPLEHDIADPVGTGPGRVLITGAGGQLGAALAQVFPDADARTRDELGHHRFRARLRAEPRSACGGLDRRWTARRRIPRKPSWSTSRERGTSSLLGAPVVYYSTDYVFDGAKGEPYVESDEANPLSVYGRTKLAGEREVRRGLDRPLLVALRLDGQELRPDDARARREAGRGGGRRRPARLADLRRSSGGSDEVRAASFLTARTTWPPVASAPGRSFAEAIFEEASLDCRVRRITTAELGRPAPRPGELGPAQRARGAGASALARRPPRMSARVSPSS